MSDNSCPIFQIAPQDLQQTLSVPQSVIAAENKCSESCACGYLQYEQLIPYLPELRSLAKYDNAAGDELEGRLREQIVEISRFFDIDADAPPGYFSRAHFDTKLLISNNTPYLRLEYFVPGTLTLYYGTNLVEPTEFIYQSGFLIYSPCNLSFNNNCDTDCEMAGSTGRHTGMGLAWPAGCYTATARFGGECAEAAIQMAVREYLIESYRSQDPVAANAQGITYQRSMRVPYSWTKTVASVKQRIQSNRWFAIS